MCRAALGTCADSGKQLLDAAAQYGDAFQARIAAQATSTLRGASRSTGIEAFVMQEIAMLEATIAV